MNNRPRLLLVLAAVLLACAQLAQAQTLWKSAAYGMKLAQVQKAFPDGTAPAEPSTLGGHDHAVEGWRLTGVNLADATFTAKFYFRGEGLMQVTLELDGKHNFHDARLIFDSVAEALTAKYGQKIANRDVRGSIDITAATWMTGKTNINVTVLAVSGNDAVLNINYQMRVAESGDNL